MVGKLTNLSRDCTVLSRVSYGIDITITHFMGTLFEMFLREAWALKINCLQWSKTIVLRSFPLKLKAVLLKAPDFKHCWFSDISQPLHCNITLLSIWNNTKNNKHLSNTVLFVLVRKKKRSMWTIFSHFCPSFNRPILLDNPCSLTPLVVQCRPLS